MCPAMPEKAEWKLTGQTIELTLPLTDSVAAVKAKIHELTNMPPGKQKINSDVSVCIYSYYFLNVFSTYTHYTCQIL